MASEKERSYRGLKLPARARLTPQRRAVLDAIEASGGRFTAIDLFERARRSHPRLGLATTYRTLELLRRTGSLHALSGDARPAYVRCSPEHHHHLVCLSCGSVEDTELCATPRTTPPVSAINVVSSRWSLSATKPPASVETTVNPASGTAIQFTRSYGTCRRSRARATRRGNRACA